MCSAKAAALALATVLAVCGAARGSSGARQASPDTAAASAPLLSASTSGLQPCGAAAAETLARTAGLVATRIYSAELASAEVFADRRQVETYSPLLRALGRHDRRAIGDAVSRLVYSHTHIVRLRVTGVAGEVLADVGGPEILAPVSGVLRRNGRNLARYSLSVQDDLGHVKLVTRFIGVPLQLSVSSRALPIEGTLSSLSAAGIPAHGAVSYSGRSYQAFSFPARAFPQGALRISLLVPVSKSLAGSACSEITVGELGHVAQRISRRFTLSPATFSDYIHATTPLTGGLIYIRAGSRQLAGSSRRGPSRLPSEGVLSYRGDSHGVSSFAVRTTVGQARVYQLVRP